MPIVLKYLITFIIGMVPIIELRGAIPIGVGWDFLTLRLLSVAF